MHGISTNGKESEEERKKKEKGKKKVVECSKPTKRKKLDQKINK